MIRPRLRFDFIHKEMHKQDCNFQKLEMKTSGIINRFICTDVNWYLD
jgi:hypothetical protein